MEVRGQRLGLKLPHHQCDSTSIESGMVRQIRCANLTCVLRKESNFSKDSFVARFTNSPVLSRFPPTSAAAQRRWEKRPD